MEAARETADYYAGFTGAVVNSLVPKVFFERSEKIKISEKVRSIPHIMQMNILSFNQRMLTVMRIIKVSSGRNSQKAHRSFSVCQPSKISRKQAKLFRKESNGTHYLLHGLMPKKQVLEITNKILAEKHPVLIIATGAFLLYSQTKNFHYYSRQRKFPLI